MLKNYLTIALRNILRNKTYSLINIAGLAVGLAASILILLYVRDEVSYDKFHVKVDRIYRLVLKNGTGGEGLPSLEMSPNLGPLLSSYSPDVEQAVRLLPRDGVTISRTAEDGSSLSFQEDGYLFADSSFFDVFSFRLLEGNPQTALTQPYSVILTSEMAQKYFGTDNPIGKELMYRLGSIVPPTPFTVTGVLKDVPPQSTLQFKFLASFETLYSLGMEARMIESGWNVIAYPTFLLLVSGASPADVESAIPQTIQEHTERGRIFGGTIVLESLKDVHLYTDVPSGLGSVDGVALYVYLFSSIAFIILLIACANYMNMATARSAKRAREVGLRKVVGAGRRQLAGQFLGESIIQCVLALVVAVILAEIAMPIFNALIGKRLELNLLAQPADLVLLLGLAFVVGLISGGYPALILSSFQPDRVLRGDVWGLTSGKNFRKILVFTQFTASLVLIIPAIVVSRQMTYVRNSRLDVRESEVLVVRDPDGHLGNQLDAFKTTLLSRPSISHVANGSLPGEETYGGGGSKTQWFYSMSIGDDYLETLGLELIDGRGFERSDYIEYNPTEYLLRGETPPPSPVRPILINEAAADLLDVDEPVGYTIRVRRSIVIGVIKDFHFMPLQKQILPLTISYYPNSSRTMFIRIVSGQISEGLREVGRVWEQFVPDHPMDYAFLDDLMDQAYQAELRMSTFFGHFSILAVFIASLGLFGLTAFATERRTKEIGIRKVLGASVRQVVGLLCKEFIFLVLIANIIAWPIAWYAMNRWLQNFAYRINLSWWTFLLAGALALTIALATVSWQAIRAATANPVEALRYE